MEISIEHLNKNYGKQNVLKDISLHIPIGTTINLAPVFFMPQKPYKHWI